MREALRQRFGALAEAGRRGDGWARAMAGRCFLKARGQRLKLSWIVLRDVGGNCRRDGEVSRCKRPSNGWIWSMKRIFRLRDEDMENEWLRERHEMLDDKAPMDLLLDGSMENLLLVKEYVEAAAGR